MSCSGPPPREIIRVAVTSFIHCVRVNWLATCLTQERCDFAVDLTTSSTERRQIEDSQLSPLKPTGECLYRVESEPCAFSVPLV
jgi:hypothetical protein